MTNKIQSREKKQILDAIKIIINGRWLYMVALGLTGLISKIFGGPNANFPIWVILLLLTIFVSFNFYYTYVYKNSDRYSLSQLKKVCFNQLAIDSLLVVALVFFAGGIISIGFLYFIFIIVSSAFIYPLKGVAFFASANSFLYASLIYLQYFGIVPYLSRYNSGFEEQLAHNLVAVSTNVFAVVTSVFIIAYYAGMLAKNIRDKEREIIIEHDREEAIITNLVDGLVFINNRGIIEMANSSAEKLLDFRAEDVVGKRTSSLDYTSLVDLGQLFRRDTKTESHLTPKSRNDTELRISSVKIKSGDGDILGTVKLIRDASREIFVDKMKSEFIMIAGHQLRTPLSAVKGSLSSLLTGDYGELSKEQKNILSQSQNYTERLIQLVNDLLNVSSIEEGKFNYHFEEVDVHHLLRDVSERFLNDAEKKDIKVRLTVLNNLSKVVMDPYKIKLALGCLVSNAIDYSSEHSTVEIVSEFNDEGEVVIKVIDQGIGIPEEVRSKIFTKFFRAENALKFDTEGNGLDLFVAKNIINNHNGEIWFESEMNRGTTFYIQLPTSQKREYLTK